MSRLYRGQNASGCKTPTPIPDRRDDVPESNNFKPVNPIRLHAAGSRGHHFWTCFPENCLVRFRESLTMLASGTIIRVRDVCLAARRSHCRLRRSRGGLSLPPVLSLRLLVYEWPSPTRGPAPGASVITLPECAELPGSDETCLVRHASLVATAEPGRRSRRPSHGRRRCGRRESGGSRRAARTRPPAP